MTHDNGAHGEPHILVIGGGREIPGRLRAAGARTTFICRLEVLPSILEVERAAGVHSLAHSAPVEAWTELAALLHARDPFTAVASFSEKDQDKAAHVAQALGLTWHSPETVTLVHDKVAMRQRLRAAGVDTTRNALAASADDVVAFGATYGWPVVVKPVQGTASSGVTVVEGPDQVPDAWSWAAGAEWVETPDVLVEEYLSGAEYSVEMFSDDGVHEPVAMTAKHSLPTHCVEVGHVVPADLPSAVQERVHAFVRDLLDALGVRRGGTHTEVKIAEDGRIRVVETHLRPPGDDTPTLVHDALGVDMIGLLVEQTLGGPALARLQSGDAFDGSGAGAAAIWYALPRFPGRVTEITGLDKARSVEHVVAAAAVIETGAQITEVRDSWTRLASVRAKAATADSALAAARCGAELIEAQVEAVPDAETDR
ncbi:ATP-grasp domain-containing protein [Streptomyces luteogriseus]|jgi:biotin carboxylase|uniref:ATP-grasp domain-containing protein n=1 Tax=Streptomyces luteogriseus TaxID=68233 RepID=UPI0037FABA02